MSDSSNASIAYVNFPAEISDQLDKLCDEVQPHVSLFCIKLYTKTNVDNNNTHFAICMITYCKT